MIVAELKSDGKHPTPAQQAWLDLLATVPGVFAYHWTPKDWGSGEIVRTLVARFLPHPVAREVMMP
jgi:hypothetical protein